MSVPASSVPASRLRAVAVVLAAALTAVPACYHYRALPAEPISGDDPGGAPAPATEFEGETVWAVAWGLVQQRPEIDNCEGQGLAEVRVTTNFAYTLLTLATLGFVSPARVQWKCAKATPAPEPIGSRDTEARGPLPALRSRTSDAQPRPGATSTTRSSPRFGATAAGASR